MQKLSLHACLDKLVIRQERAGLDVHDSGSVRQVGGPDVPSSTRPPDDLRTQDVGLQLAVELRAKPAEETLHHRRFDYHRAVIPAEELLWLLVLCAGSEQL